MSATLRAVLDGKWIWFVVIAALLCMTSGCGTTRPPDSECTMCDAYRRAAGFVEEDEPGDGAAASGPRERYAGAADDDRLHQELIRPKRLPLPVVPREHLFPDELTQLEVQEMEQLGTRRRRPTGPSRLGEVWSELEVLWHENDFQIANTQGIRESAFRGARVSASHCFFAALPNRATPIFALLVKHGPRGDTFHLGREGMAIAAVQMGELGNKGPLHLVEGSEMLCVFRGDENEVGALIFEFHHGQDRDQSAETKFALIEAKVYAQEQPTNRFIMVDEEAQRAAQVRQHPSQRAQDEEAIDEDVFKVRVYEYVKPEARVVGVFATRQEALAQAAAILPRGRFRLREEQCYPYMSWQSYFDIDEPEFCPVGVGCRAPRNLGAIEDDSSEQTARE